MDYKKAHTVNSSQILDSLMSNASLGIIYGDESGVILRYNRLAKDLLQINTTGKSATGDNILDCIDHIPSLHEKLSWFLTKKRKSFIAESIGVNERYLIVKGVSIGNGFICIINDITRMKEMEIESIQSIIAGQEIERRRIAREIHDGIGPLLSYAKLELDAYIDEFENTDQNRSEGKLKNIRQTLDFVAGDLRDLSHHLIPRLLEEFGLFSAFNNLTIKINNSVKPKIEFYCNFNSEIRFDSDLELNLYRCGQELLHNAIKHAEASEILVQIIKHDSSIVLMVEDDGIGFEQNATEYENFGIGLTNIKTRVRTLNGAFIMESAKNTGTTASIEIPLLQ